MAAVAIQTATAAKGLDRFAEFTPAPGLNPARLSLGLHPKGEGVGSRVVSAIPAMRACEKIAELAETLEIRAAASSPRRRIRANIKLELLGNIVFAEVRANGD